MCIHRVEALLQPHNSYAMLLTMPCNYQIGNYPQIDSLHVMRCQVTFHSNIGHCNFLERLLKTTPVRTKKPMLSTATQWHSKPVARKIYPPQLKNIPVNIKNDKPKFDDNKIKNGNALKFVVGVFATVSISIFVVVGIVIKIKNYGTNFMQQNESNNIR